MNWLETACNTPKTSVTAKDPAMSFYFRRELFFLAVSFSLLPWAFLFCRELFFFAVSFSLLPWAFLFSRELFFFAVSFSFLPWAFLFCRELFSFAVSFSFLTWAFLFCRELFSFAVSFSFLPWAFIFCRELFFIPVALVGHRSQSLYYNYIKPSSSITPIIVTNFCSKFQTQSLCTCKLRYPCKCMFSYQVRLVSQRL